MRPLIRPFLWAAVRLGLFLSVVACVLGQWWNVGFTFDVGGRSPYVFVCQEGWVTGVCNEAMGWDFTVARPSEFGDITSFFDPTGHLDHYGSLMGAALLDNAGPAVSVRHWAIIVGSACLGVALWLSRKRVIQQKNHASSE